MTEKKLQDRVIMITGAARGIGRACAIEAARHGAKLVINDIGAGLDGKDADDSPILELKKEVEALGAEVMADSTDISDYAGVGKLFNEALERYGQVDGLINPAGILRDKMFHKMSEEDWDNVISVHLKGSFNLARSAINHFREKEDGAFVFFTSTSGLIGNIGQTNYGAAKSGINSLIKIIAMENASKNIRANVIAPFAFTRMIESIPIRDERSRQRVERMRKNMRADQVATLAVALCCPMETPVTGQILCARGNEIFLFNQPRPIRALGATEGWSVDGILNHALPAMQESMTDLKDSAGVFTWDPI